MKNKELYEKVFEIYGKEAQMIKCIEELAELSVALCHHKLGREGAAEEIANELADCGIVLDQMDILFGTVGLMDEREADLDFEYKPKALISDTFVKIGLTQLWLAEYGGNSQENKALKKLFKNLRVNFRKLTERFGMDDIANCRAFKLRRLELRLNLGAKV